MLYTLTTMESLFDIMGNKDFDIPPEVLEIKAYIKRHFDSEVEVSIQAHTITIAVKSAPFAGSLRPHLHKIKKEINTEKKLLIRII